MTTVLWKTDEKYDFKYDKIIFGGYDIKEIKDKEEKIKVMHVKYPKGSYAGDKNNKGGCGFYSDIEKVFPAKSMYFEYQVYFDPNFDFVLGGKLPGLYGGVRGANGGNHPDDGFSIRLMWRKNGDGEIYAYVPKKQHDDYKNIVKKSDGYGDSLFRGSFKFQKNKWHKIRIYLKLNNKDKFDGVIKLYFDNKKVASYSKLNYGSFKNMNIEGIFFNTFFGGSNSTKWASTLDTYTYFKDFNLSVKN